jgi:alpha,alpha-trehalose phosphorylase
VDHDFDETVIADVRGKLHASRARVTFEVDAAVGQTVKLTKWLAYHYGPEEAADLADRTELTLNRARGDCYAGALADHQRQVRNFWERSEVVWEGGRTASWPCTSACSTSCKRHCAPKDMGCPRKA